MNDSPDKKSPKSPHAEREERILAFWREKGIFERSLKKDSPKGQFTFYEGPPTANGRPGIHHLEARAFKDAIPRYKTMRGYHVRRKGGWDTHGLPVELQVEKELGLKSKKEIETFGIAAFNEKCKESVWKYVHEWENFTDRMGHWIDLKDPYITYKPDYIESVWNIVKKIDGDGLLYKDYKVLPWCPRCGTALSSHELAQGYEDVKDLAVTVKFEVIDHPYIYFLVWTTTPWTLPGNAGLAVNPKTNYVYITKGEEHPDTARPIHYILAKDLLSKVFPDGEYKIVKEVSGADLVNVEYDSPYPFLRDAVSGAEKEKLANAFKVYAADFVTTEEGTGIVHMAPMYGQDDFELGTKVGLPKYHLVNEDGTFKKETGFLAGKFVKDEATDVEIIKDLASRGLLFHKEKHQHSYPFCWRCHTPLIYFARDSWYIRMSALRNKLVKENESINWQPEHIKEGRFGEWLKEVKDWAISRERYWGTPLPIWVCNKCHSKRVVGSIKELKVEPRNTYYVMRHGEAESNITNVWSIDPKSANHLTEKGREQVKAAAESFKDVKPDLIFTSPLMRTKETAEILKSSPGFEKAKIIEEDRLREMGVGKFDGTKGEEFMKIFPLQDRFGKAPDGVENYFDIKKRLADLLHELEHSHTGKIIFFVTHGAPAMLLNALSSELDQDQFLRLEGNSYIVNAEIRKLDFSILPHNPEYELDLHRPYIDEVKLKCACGGDMSRVKEVMDVWFDSGAMPFAQDHYPFEEGIRNKEEVKSVSSFFRLPSFLSKPALAYPADFIAEAVDQTRGWFYTLHAVGTLMGKGKAFKNVICLGHILDAEGKKMSKSVGNVVEPQAMMDKYGADALRFWMYSVNQPGESKNFDEKTVDEVVKKVFNLAANVLAFYKLYEEKTSPARSASRPLAKGELAQTIPPYEGGARLALRSLGEGGRAGDVSSNVLDKWIIARLNQLIENVTKNLDNYVFLEPTRAIRDFIADLSQWYLRRSRDRFKSEGEDKQAALATTRYVLLTLAKVMAPFTPFFAEYLYTEVGGPLESVHLEEWPEISAKFKVQSSKLIEDMQVVRDVSSKALEARMKSKINVRQPLQTLRFKIQDSRFKNNAGLIDLIKDEVNVKEVVFDSTIEGDVVLDTKMTPELKEEGSVRELIRAIQDLRKEKGLTVSDRAVLTIDTDNVGRAFVEKFRQELMKAALLKDVKFEANDSGNIDIGDISMKLKLV